MRSHLPASSREQVATLRRQFLQDGDLPFTNVLTEQVIAQALTAVTGWLDRVFSPLVTLWVFLGQVLGVLAEAGAAIAGGKVGIKVAGKAAVTLGANVAGKLAGKLAAKSAM